jgi:hypothetical protein
MACNLQARLDQPRGGGRTGQCYEVRVRVPCQAQIGVQGVLEPPLRGDRQLDPAQERNELVARSPLLGSFCRRRLVLARLEEV